MELKTITLSDSMRQRLETAMSSVRARYIATQDSDLLLAAFSAALWEDPISGKENFGLKPLTEQQKKESSELISAIVVMANGSGNPAMVIENLPHADEEIYKFALIGLSLSINSGRKTLEDRSPSEKENARDHYTGRAKNIIHQPLKASAITTQSYDELHSDSAGYEKSGPEMRMLAGKIVGSRPLSTVVVTVDEWINEIANNIRPRDGINPEWNKQDIRSAVIEILEANIWEKPSKNDSSNLNSTGQPFIFRNLNTDVKAPKHGLLLNPRKQMKLCKNSGAKLAELHLTDSFAKMVITQGDECLKHMKNAAAGLVIEPGQVLLWNDQMTLHSPGKFQERVEGEDFRELLSIHIPLSHPQGTTTPGAVPLACTIQSADPNILVKTLGNQVR